MNDSGNKIPKHVGLIMDGNGRWATRQGLSRLVGHRVGLDHIRKVLPICFRLGIEIVSGYLWSAENWRRPPAEVANMRCLLRTFGLEFARELHEQNVRIIHSGHRDGLLEEELAVIDEAVALTRHNGPSIFNIVFNYSGRHELVHAARQIAAQGLIPTAINEDTVTFGLFMPLPDLDLVIRTAGEFRLSNFLLWQSASAIFYVTDVYWPDVTQQEIEEAIQFYQKSLGYPLHHGLLYRERGMPGLESG